MENNIPFNYNVVEVVGIISTEPELHHEHKGVKFYQFQIQIARLSGIIDELQVITIDINNIHAGMTVKVSGSFRSYNKYCDGKSRLLLYIHSTDIEVVEDTTEHQNSIKLDGYVCNKITLRETPAGKTISDTIVAVNRSFGRSDFIPVIFWNTSAKAVYHNCVVGSHIKIEGRIQSREYLKRYDSGEEETRTAFEVSTIGWEKLDDNCIKKTS